MKNKVSFIIPSKNKRSVYWQDDDGIQCKLARIEREDSFYNEKEAKKCKDGYIMLYEERVKLFKNKEKR